MDRYLSMLESSRLKPITEEEKLKFFISKISIVDFFGVSERTYRAKMLTKYCSELYEKYYGAGNFFFLFVSSLSLAGCNFLPGFDHSGCSGLWFLFGKEKIISF